MHSDQGIGNRSCLFPSNIKWASYIVASELRFAYSFAPAELCLWPSCSLPSKTDKHYAARPPHGEIPRTLMDLLQSDQKNPRVLDIEYS